ncbi:MAG: hypothetical protein ACR2PY_08670 [Salinispira sp.]
MKKFSHKNLLKIFLGYGRAQDISEAEWDVLVDHITTHRFFLGESGTSVSWQDALVSWYVNVYQPLRKIATSSRFARAFPRMNVIQRICALSTHWYYMKEHKPDTAPDNAGISFIVRYGRGIERFFARFLIFFIRFA